MQENKFSIKNANDKLILRKGQSREFNFSYFASCPHPKHKLFFTCEDTKFYRFKGEGRADILYMMIDDSLNETEAEENTYCLDMSCDTPKPYAKRCAYKIFWGPNGVVDGAGNTWSTGIFAKARDLVMGEGGYLRFVIEKWFVKDGVTRELTADAPDETTVINISEGTYDYRASETVLDIDNSKTACVLIVLEGENYQGQVYFERPFFVSSNGIDLLPDFDVNIIKSERFTWCGQNLSKREWPRFELRLNGNKFFEGEVFLSMHRFSPVEIDIPDHLISKGNNTLSIKYTSDYFMTIPVLIGDISLLEKSADSIEVLYCPKHVVSGTDIKILLETNEDNLSFCIESEDVELISENFIESSGIHTITLKALRQKNDLTFTMVCNGLRKTYTIGRMVSLKNDGVICGSGDMIYVDNSDEKAVKEYITWFLSEEIGKLFTIRPVYHWGGGRFINPKVWEFVKQICTDMELSHVLMSDGRDLPGIAQNPSSADINGVGFLGRQLHERDGQLFYWSTQPRDTIPLTDTFFDLAMREFRASPQNGEGNYNPENIMFKNGRYSFKRVQISEPDMKQGHDTATDRIKAFAKDFTRHTGPGVMFKYFYEQGFEWLGAETMDSATEPLLSFLRGASKAYRRQKTGVHHALQWSTYPHDTEQRYRRFMLVNFLSYMHGVTDINTEEGFWFIEAGYDYHNRFSDACARHREIQKKFSEYISTHSRTGEFYTPTAFIHGRYDGWNGFNGAGLWGMDSLPVGEAEKSWELLKIFYPLCHITQKGMAKTGYIPADNDKPFGCYSGTPNGCVDVIPVENGRFGDYKLMCFAGYNAATNEDFDRLYEYVENGGYLVMSWAHFSELTSKASIDSGRYNIISHKITEPLSSGKPIFENDTVSGKDIRICTNILDNADIPERTDSGKPLVISVNLGMGRLILFNTLEYPGNDAVYEIYSDVVKRLHRGFMEEEESQIICGDDVEYTVWKQDNGDRHYYITPVDWYNSSTDNREASLRIGKDIYPLSLQFGVITKVVVSGNTGAFVTNADAEILSLSPTKAVVQGVGETSLITFRNGKATEYNAVFDDLYKKEIVLINQIAFEEE